MTILPLLSPINSNGVFTSLAVEAFVRYEPMRDALAADQDRYAQEAGFARQHRGEWVTKPLGQLAC